MDSIVASPDWLVALVLLIVGLVASGHPIGISMAVTLPLAAAVLFLVLRLTHSPGSYRQALAVTVYSAYPRLIKGLLISVVVYAHLGVYDLHNPLRSSFGALVDAPLHPHLFALASAFDPFTLWSLALVSIGLTRVSGMRPVKSAAIVFGLWALVVIFAVITSTTPPRT